LNVVQMPCDVVYSPKSSYYAATCLPPTLYVANASWSDPQFVATEVDVLQPLAPGVQAVVGVLF
jgi:hypothetical protein